MGAGRTRDRVVYDVDRAVNVVRNGEAGTRLNGEDFVLAIGVEKAPRDSAGEAVGRPVKDDLLTLFADDELSASEDRRKTAHEGAEVVLASWGAVCPHR